MSADEGWGDYPATAEAHWIGRAEAATDLLGDAAFERLAHAVARLSDLFTTERPEGRFPNYFAEEELLAAYAEIDRERPLRDLRPCISHSNFMTPETVAAAARMGVVMDIQPIWLYLDTRTLVAQFGYERLRWFQPLRSILAAGGVAAGAIRPIQPV